MIDTLICSKCGKEKPKKEFFERKSRKRGYTYKCKSCLKEYKTNWRRTEHGLVRRIYENQIKTSKHRGHNLPAYTFEQLKEWIFNQPNWKACSFS